MDNMPDHPFNPLQSPMDWQEGPVRVEGLGTNRDLKRRYYLIQRAKDASIVG